MTRDLPSLKALAVFEVAARLGSFSRAAEELNVTQSAVSRQIQLLESQLGAALFARNGPRLALTTLGRDYQATVENGLGVIRRGTRRLFRERADTRSVTLSTVPSLVSRWLIPRLGRLRRSHPEISLRLDATFRMVDFAAETDIDIAVRYGRGGWPALDAEVLAEDFLVPVCSPRLAREIHSPEDLLRYDLLVDEPRADRWDYWLDAVGVGVSGRAKARLSDDFNVQLQAATLGHGVALARGLLVADDLRTGRLVPPIRAPITAPEQYYFVCPPERASDPRIRVLRKWLLQEAATTIDGLDALCGKPITPPAARSARDEHTTRTTRRVAT